jgi:hypothetical protein
MTKEFDLSAAFSSPAHSHAIGGLFGDAVQVTVPMVAALGDVVALMELGQPAAIFFGLLIMTYGAATLSYTRAALGRAKPYPGIRSVTTALRASPRGAGAVVAPELVSRLPHYCTRTWLDRPSRMRWKWIN